MTGQALAGELPFRWQTDFDYSWMGGWLQEPGASRPSAICSMMIPGKDRRRAVIMADHYDTAYMADHYDKAIRRPAAPAWRPAAPTTTTRPPRR